MPSAILEGVVEPYASVTENEGGPLFAADGGAMRLFHCDNAVLGGRWTLEDNEAGYYGGESLFHRALRLACPSRGRKNPTCARSVGASGVVVRLSVENPTKPVTDLALCRGYYGVTRLCAAEVDM